MSPILLAAIIAPSVLLLLLTVGLVIESANSQRRSAEALERAAEAAERTAEALQVVASRPMLMPPPLPPPDPSLYRLANVAEARARAENADRATDGRQVFFW